MAAFLKVGTLRSTARWLQSGDNSWTSRSHQLASRAQSRTVKRATAAWVIGLVMNCGHFEAARPPETDFPPSKRWPNVAVSSPFRPGGGGEGLGERGGIQEQQNPIPREPINEQSHQPASAIPPRRADGSPCRESISSQTQQSLSARDPESARGCRACLRRC